MDGRQLERAQSGGRVRDGDWGMGRGKRGGQGREGGWVIGLGRGGEEVWGGGGEGGRAA